MRYVALLRGIAPMNPNMRNERLRAAFERMGFSHVETVISSGNVLFESDSRAVKALESKIEQEIKEQLGFFSTTIIRSHSHLRRLVESDPYGGINDTKETRLNVTFLKAAPTVNLPTPYQLDGGGFSIVRVEGKEVFTSLALSDATTPDLMTWLDKTFGKQITTRTWKTVGRILKKLAAGPDPRIRE